MIHDSHEYYPLQLPIAMAHATHALNRAPPIWLAFAYVLPADDGTLDSSATVLPLTRLTDHAKC